MTQATPVHRLATPSPETSSLRISSRTPALAWGAALAVALLAAGCGGGGDSTAATTTPTQPVTTDVTTIPVVDTTTPAATVFTAARPFSATGNEVLDWINTQRDACGVGAARANTLMAASALNHSSYLLTNNLIASHIETAGMSGYTGQRVGDRASAVGYDWSFAIEGVASYSASDLVGMRALMGLPYHRIALLDHRLQDMGVASARATTGASAGLGLSVVNAAVAKADHPQALQALAQGACVYPAPGATGVPIIIQAESPNPTPELGAWGASTYPGYTASVQIPANQALTVNAFTITEPSGRSVPVKVIDRNDPIKLKADGITHWAFAVPLEPLKAATTYMVTFTGMADSTPLARNWSFSTRSAQVAVESVSATADKAIIRMASPGDHLNMGSVQAWAACGAGYSFTATAGSIELVVRHNSPPAPGCGYTFGVMDPVSRQESTLSVALPN